MPKNGQALATRTSGFSQIAVSAQQRAKCAAFAPVSGGFSDRPARADGFERGISRGLGQVAGEADGGQHGGWIGQAAAGDAEGGAVIGTGPGFGQPERDVDRRLEIQQFERNQSLVVIHGDHGIEVPAGRVAEHRVGNRRAGENTGVKRVETPDGRGDDAGFLIAKSPAFAGVGVQPGDGDAGPGNAATVQEPVGELADAHDALRREQRGHGGQGLVDGSKAHRQGRPGEEHAEVRHAKRMGEKFRLPGKRKPDRLERVLADGPGDHCVRRACGQAVGGKLQRLEGRPGGAQVGLSGGPGITVAEDFKHAVTGELPGGEGLVDDLRADAGGVAEGDEDVRHG